MDKDVEERREGPQANTDTREDVIHLADRDPKSVAHIRSPRLVHPEQVKDFIVKVIEDDSSK
jgi:hypothetical protein